MKQLILKHKEVIFYLFFGGCTTLVNILVYCFCTRIVKVITIPATAIAWILSVAFAYVTNRTWVFESKNHGLIGILKECGMFVVCRFASGILDVAIMWIFVDAIGMNDLIIKMISNIIVIIINYAASKWFIFTK